MSRGFGFVEFDSIAEAQRWMEYQQVISMIVLQFCGLLYQQNLAPFESCSNRA